MSPLSTILDRRKGFTLIELLVVVAIIAILAAILFPVFAQAKAAAKKTACLSNIKQVNTGTHMYLSDNEDAYPLATPFADGRWNSAYCADIPWDWETTLRETWQEANRATWGNTVQPYLKSLELVQSPVQQVLRYENCLMFDPAKASKKYYSASYAMNGLLEGMSATAIVQPAKLIAFHQPLGKTSLLGMAFADPYLYCDHAGQPCRYRPTHSGCDNSQNGDWSGRYNFPGLYLGPAHPRGGNFAYADGHARFGRMAANVKGRTDYRADPNTQYDAFGKTKLAWYDGSYCHALLFRPDFDFETWGNPVEGL